MHINKQHQLVELRSKRNIQFLEINADEFLAGDLLLYLFRYAAWALAEGGCAEVTASKTVDSMGILMARWSFQSVLQSAVKGIANIASLVSVDLKCRKFTFQRYSKPLIRDNPWSAAVMFSPGSIFLLANTPRRRDSKLDVSASLVGNLSCPTPHTV